MLIQQALEINAPAENVWRILTTFDDYGSWNPFAVRCASSMVPGEPIDMWVRLGPGRPRRQREWIRTHTPGVEFSYAIRPLPFGALRSLRSQSVTTLEDGRTRYVSRFELRGWLAPIVAGMYGRGMSRGFEAATAALRLRAESQIGPNETTPRL